MRLALWGGCLCEVGMSEEDLIRLLQNSEVPVWRARLARWVESSAVQNFIVAIILLNGLILGLETSSVIMGRFGGLLVVLDKLCLVVFLLEITVLSVYRWHFWRNGWNWF